MDKLGITFQFTKDGCNPLADVTTTPGIEDAELVEGGKLWRFLETTAQYEGKLQTLYESTGSYTCTQAADSAV